MTPEQREQEQLRRVTEVRRCRDDFLYFVATYCQILASADGSGEWIPFQPWPAQRQTAEAFQHHREIIILKARQLGFTWLALSFALWQILFHPIATVLLFSKRDDEATELLALRLRGVYDHLPDWLKVRSGFKVDNDHEWELCNGSRALAFATTGGRSYTATLAIVDEADHVPDLQAMLNSIKPTVDAGGRLVLLSTADKAQPESLFKKIYRAAKQGQNSYRPIFHGWRAAPWRTEPWYDEQQRTILAQTGALDDLHQEYPATDIEALSPRSLDKRIPAVWLQQCFIEQQPVEAVDAPAIPGLVVYARPRPGRSYVLGADPAEGNPTSDDSALAVLDCQSGEEVAALAGKFEPSVFASYAYAVAVYFNRAAILCERNNHGHAVLLWLTNFGQGVLRLCGRDGRAGWMSSNLGKTSMYDKCADAFKNKEAILHSFSTFTQLASIDGRTLHAPDNLPDDRADAFALAVCGRAKVLSFAAEVSAEPCLLTPGREPDPFFGSFGEGGGRFLSGW